MLFERHLMYSCLKNKGIWNVRAEVKSSLNVNQITSDNPEIVNKESYYHCTKCDKTKYPDTYIKVGKDCKNEGNDFSWYKFNCYEGMSTYDNYEKRYLKAANIHKECALMSTSWGLGQIIGANFRNKFKTVEEMEFSIFNGGDAFQLLIMSEYIKANRNLVEAINDKDWSEVANIYNGPLSQDNNYEEKLKNAYNEINK